MQIDIGSARSYKGLGYRQNMCKQHKARQRSIMLLEIEEMAQRMHKIYNLFHFNRVAP